VADSFTCPRCNRTSHNKMDVKEGYCGYCHDWTGPQRYAEDPFSRDEHATAPGLRVHATPIDAAEARQVTYIGSESSAMHSRSKGWIPTVFLTLDHVALIGPGNSQRLKLMLTATDVEHLLEHLQGALRGAHADAAYGPREDTDG
jgi:hypothetical protein